MELGAVPLTFAGLGNADGSHSGGGCRLDAQVGVFKDKAVFGATPRRAAAVRNASGAGLPCL